jgi:rubrerythrin
MSKTYDNLLLAAQGEAFARLKYMAFAQKAMEEGHPEVAQLFEEAAGAETIHGINHLIAAGFVKSTKENLNSAAMGEQDEIDDMYPKMISDAQIDSEATEEEKAKAISAFETATKREVAHNAMFKKAMEEFKD